MKSRRIIIILLSLAVLIGILLARQGIFHRPDQAELLRRAAVLEKNGECRQALPVLKKLLESGDDFPEKSNAVVLLARCYSRLEDWNQADFWWKKATRLSTSRYRDEAVFNRGVVAEIQGRDDAARRFREQHSRLFPESSRAASVRLALARSKKAAGDLAGARQDYLLILESYSRRPEGDEARRELGAINTALLYSPRRDEYGREYTVQSGDTLSAIAAAHHTTSALLRDINGIRGEIIRIGQKLKVPAGSFRVEVSKAENTVSVYLENKFFKVYPAGTGRGGSTPVGTFTIVTKLIDPPWFHNGEVIPPHDPANILGSRWMGFSDPYADYGIHGTTEPETIGSQCSAGCVRMRNEDVEELFQLLPRGTEITIK